MIKDHNQHLMVGEEDNEYYYILWLSTIDKISVIKLNIFFG